jgi:uncharacterized protein YdeI (YjbR/CyaY-like superfamily)
MKKMNPKIDLFLCREEKWQEEFKQLRTIILDCGLKLHKIPTRPSAVDANRYCFRHSFERYSLQLLTSVLRAQTG